ncbi:5-methyltetrahydrofolate--homocysteine methyltransferase [Caldanaerobius fijiensis DSM 17918]|uniref:5-methyltetrahydrofolate--homocysteine methyltransferase n=1 Tax=Caldanaerobius fijiensis DSM 17918 TaxID=1121256 RepID=A0A1M4WL73_9THEO|nr:hypothetical protein [Caldanaerobius fijiensis]SHE81944.1 5-methyltetrahydrofolate--homocysteine methyltransferase [Caldanaerobius fijiensis DSM 17918]
MLYKECWEETKSQYEKWWNKELKKPLLSINAPKKFRRHQEYEWNGWDLLREKGDPEKAVDNFEAMAEDFLFLGESYPNLWLNLGPGVMAAYITGFLGFSGDTAWFEHPMEWDDIEKALISLKQDNEWWVYTKTLAHLIGKRSQGKFLTGMTDLGGIMDILASLRGTENLLYDLIDQPERVINAMDRILELWHICYDELNNILSQYMEGTSAWMGLWCPTKWYPIQCDFSVMISPEMFEKFVAPYLREQARRLDHTIYHWDGPGEIPHLDILLDIDEIDGIQWVPGAGNENVDSEAWLELYERIQNKGKLLVLNGADPEKISWLFERISPEGVYVSVYCDSEDKAYELLEWREKLNG